MDISEIRKANLLKLIQEKASGSQKDFAQTVGTAPAYLSQIINGTVGRNGKPATVGTALARKIEKAYDLEHGWMDAVGYDVKKLIRIKEMGSIPTALFGDHRYSEPDEKLFKGPRVPVISWTQAANYTYVEFILEQDPKITDWLAPNENCGPDGFGLKVAGSSMSPMFLPGDYLYVNPSIQNMTLKTNDIVVVACDSEPEATFKKLIIENSEMYLQSLNPNWPEPIKKLKDNCVLIGKVVGLYREFS